eukprot:4065518-Prymnesium_polylepis.1
MHRAGATWTSTLAACTTPRRIAEATTRCRTFGKRPWGTPTAGRARRGSSAAGSATSSGSTNTG